MKTCEIVSPKHPDKLCDQISDAVLDACLAQDPESRVAIETKGSHGIITVSGELTTKAFVDIPKIVKSIVGEEYGIQVNIESQSPEIARGVDTGGAGDQGIMIGYACDENEQMVPTEFYLTRLLCKFLYEKYPYDGKTQITINDDRTINTIVASFQNTTTEELRESVFEWLTQIDIAWQGKEPPQVLCNTAGEWKKGSFAADTGLTGRKIVVDAYGPQIPVGGGAFSGKDATKVDRSGAYMARSIAVKMLDKLQAKEVLVRVAYAIGLPDPVMFSVRVDGDEYDMQDMEKHFGVRFQLRPQEIINLLDLKKPQYQKTAEFGHFGQGFTWDR